jgi:hypothetical protein
MEDPTGETQRLSSSKYLVGLSQTLDLGSVIGMLIILR